MNSMIYITIRARAAEARREIAATSADVKALRAEMAMGSAASAGMIPQAAMTRMAKWGSQIQWAGRQLTTNFTLPVAAAGTAMMKWSLDYDSAMTRLRKVYDGAASDMDKFAKGFELLSERYAVAQSEVAEIAGSWAAAGAKQGVVLRGVEATLQTMILGEMDAAEATSALIAIQAQYGYDTEQLIGTIQKLNSVENATGISMSGLIQGMSRAAGAARTAGVDVEHLSALLAALVPATGGAEQAGNALKTMISRIMAPTDKAAEIMGMMGINIEDVAWKSSSAVDRIETLSKAFHDLEGSTDSMISAQAALVSAEVASRWNINRFDVMMRDVYNSVTALEEGTAAGGIYGKSLEILGDPAKVAATAISELNTVLESDAMLVKRSGIVIQNSLMKVLAAALPQIVSFIGMIAEAFRAFSNIDPATQKFIMFLAAMLALIGPPIILLGSFAVAIGRLGQMFLGINKGIKFALTGFGIFSTASKATAGSAAADAATVAGSSVAMASGVAAGTGSAAAADAAAADVMKVSAASKIAAFQRTAAAAIAEAGGISAAVATQARAVQIGAAQIIAAGSLTSGAMVRHTAIELVSRTTAGAAMVRWTEKTIAAYGVATNATRKWVGAVQTGYAKAGAVTATQLTNLSNAHAVATAKIDSVHKRAATYMSWAWQEAGGKVVAAHQASTTILPRLWDGANAAILRSGAAMHIALNGMMDRTMAGLATDVAAINAMAANPMMLAGKPSAGASAKRSAAAAQGAAAQGAMAGAQMMLAFSSKVKAIPLAIGNAFKSAGPAIVGATKSWGVAIWAAIKGVGPAIATGFRSLAPLLLSAGKGLLMGLLSILPALGKGLMGFFRGLMPAIGKILLVGVRFLVGPWGLAITAIIGIFLLFKDQIAEIWGRTVRLFTQGTGPIASAWTGIKNIFRQGVEFVQRGFNMLPEGVQGALKSVVNMVRDAALKVYEWFSYFNPFQRHSPSLVENVTRGMTVVGNQFGLASAKIKTHAMDAYRSLQTFGVATASFMDRYNAMLATEERGVIAKWVPEAIRSYDDLTSKVRPLRADLADIGDAMDRQANVVGDLKVALDAAQATYDELDYTLAQLKNTADSLSDSLSQAQAKLDEYASSPIQGMRAMSDAMFENEMAQKRLQLAMMDWEDVNGSIDDVTSRMASLQGSIESLRGEASDLSMAGAGSDILGPIKGQIAEMEAAYAAMESGVNNSPVGEMQSELEKLQRAGERMDLENSIQFDPLTRQIEQLAQVYNELPFDEIIAGVARQSVAVSGLQSQYDEAANAVLRQQVAVDAASATVATAQRAYDLQSASLDNLKTAYSAVEEEIRAIEDAINSVVQAATSMEQALEAAKSAKDAKADDPSMFEKFAGGAYEDVGGSMVLADEAFSIEEWFDEFAGQDLFAGINPFDGLKAKWDEFLAWWNTNVTPIFSNLGEAFTTIFTGLDTSSLEAFGERVSGVWGTITEWGGKLGELFGPQITNIWENIKSAWGPAIDTISEKFGPLVESVKGLFASIGDYIGQAWKVVGPYLMLIVGLIVGVFSGLFRAIGNIVGPIIEWIGNIIGAVIQVITGVINTVKGVFTFISGLIQTIVSLFTGDWSGLQAGLAKMWEGIKGMFGGIAEILGAIWSAIWSTISGLIAVVWGAVSGFVQGIVDFFTWLWDVLVGHSIVPDMVNAIIDWFKKMWDKAVEFVSGLVTGVVDFFQGLWDKAVAIFNGMKDGVTSAFDTMGDGLKTAWNWISTNVFDKIKDGAQWVWDKFVAVKDGVVNSFNLMKEGLGIAWNWIRDNVVDRMVNGFQNMWDKAVGIKDGIVNAWNLMKDGLGTVGTWISTYVFDPLKTAVEAVGTAFDNTQQFISTAWDKIKSAAAKPVNFIIDKVYTGGIKNVWDKIAGAVGISLTLPTVSPIAFANGSEDHRAQIAKGGAMRLWAEPETGGEAYIPLARSKRPRSESILGAVANKFGYNLTAFKDGGFWNNLGAGISNAGKWIKDAAVNVGNFIGDPVGAIGDMISKPVETLMKNLGGGKLGEMLVEYPRNAIEGIIAKAKAWATGKSGTAATGSATGSVVAGALAGLPTLGGWRRPSTGRITSQYGPRSLLGGTFHAGVDFAGGAGKRTYAGNTGVVEKVQFGALPGVTGLGIVIGHGNGLQSYYGHNPVGGPKVSVGQMVGAGQWIGQEGSTGNVTGDHLHYGIRKGGSWVNPAGYYDNGGYLPTGTSIVTNATGSPEPVFTSGQWGMLSGILSSVTSILPSLSAAAGPSIVAGAQSELVNAMHDLAAAMADVRDSVSNGAGETHNYFYGDLSFPGVQDGDDAEAFIRNLADLT